MMFNMKIFKLYEPCILSSVDKKSVNTIFNCLYSIKTNLKKISNISDDKPIITCKRKDYNFYPGQIIGKLDNVKLASRGWHNKKSRGDYFIFHMSDDIEILDNSHTFENFGLNNKLIINLRDKGIINPTFIQSKSIPVLLSRKNALIAAETGCGKTYAYLLPALHQIISYKTRNSNDNFNAPLCLILTPSRELAFQIEEVARHLIHNLNIKTDVIVGGGTKKRMLNPTFKEVDLLVATIGALSKLTTTGIYKMTQLQHVILDEADTLLDESFSEKMTYFLKKIPFQSFTENTENCIGTQLTLASATMPINLPRSLEEIIAPDSLIRITSDQLHKILPHVPQRFLRLGRSMKPSQLLQMVKADVEKRYPVIIFSNKSATCDWISMFLNENGVKSINLNGDMSLQLRKDRFSNFQRENIHVISCTDIGSRGLDTVRAKHIINYDFPKYTADYVHRCGRTGRIGSPENCHVTNFISGTEEVDLVQKIEFAVRTNKCLPNVNGNISGIIKNNILRSNREEL